MNFHILLSLLFLANGVWLLMKLIGYSVPFDWILSQKISIWLAAFTSIYSGMHIITIAIKHHTIQKLL